MDEDFLKFRLNPARVLPQVKTLTGGAMWGQDGEAKSQTIEDQRNRTPRCLFYAAEHRHMNDQINHVAIGSVKETPSPAAIMKNRTRSRGN